ncbi:MAG: hypothetical protein O3C39_00545 [Planctomycetota bacterium]|jgi:Na+/proline symporter|nr:hypothetical protein [Planctomycetota bacterium]MDA1200150.1 hypothetical protein [Planctomycetota bacterium]
MADGFLRIFIGMVAGWTLFGAIIGFAFAKQNRKQGAIMGTIVGLALGSVMASVTSFGPSSSKETQTVVAE